MLGAEQAKAMVDVWRQGTQKAWETWFDAFGPPTGMTGMRGIAALRPPPATDTWSEALAQGLRAWVDQAVPVAQSFVARLLPDPGPLGALFDASLAAWQAAGRHVAAPDIPPGPQAFGALAERLGESLSPLEAVRRPELGAVAEDLGELWIMYLETLKKLSRPWFEALGAPDPVEVVAHDPGHHSGLVRFGELSWDVFERTFGRLLQSPSIGFTRELNEKLLGAFSAWLDFRRANVEYQVAVSAALSRSTTKFLHELASLARKGEPVGSLRDLLGLWGDTLDGVLIESFRSEEYARVQGNVVRAAMAYRMREREAMDVLGRISHVPTRGEIDEIARHLYELRKEVRDVRRASSRPERPQQADGGDGSDERPSPAGTAETAGSKPPGAKPKPPGAKPKPPGAKPKPPGAQRGTAGAGPEAATPEPEPDASGRPPAGRGKDQS